jgi:transcriptional regulator with GAF, ATPase, and Fis domain
MWPSLPYITAQGSQKSNTFLGLTAEGGEPDRSSSRCRSPSSGSFAASAVFIDRVPPCGEQKGLQVNESALRPESTREVQLLHEIGSRIAAADPFHAVLDRIVEVVTEAVRCDSCFIYVLERDHLILRASMNPHADVIDRLNLSMGEGITGWAAKHKRPAAVSERAWEDARFARKPSLEEDRFEAFLAVPVLCRGKLVGVINVQHREPHRHTEHEIRLISLIGYLVGAEVELAHMEFENSQLTQRLETRKLMDRAKGILQRDLGLDEEAAYLMLQKQSRQKRKTIREMAEIVILMEDMRRSSK